MKTELKEFAKRIRLQTLKELNHLGFGHYGGSLSVIELLAVLYGKVMKYDPNNPNWEERDYFVLSKGHAGPALYATLALSGFFPVEDLLTLNQNGTNFPSHPDRLKTKGVDVTTGSLGQGISIAAGIALSHKLSNKQNRTFVVLGDGELNEGQCWEAFQFIAHHKLTNLITFIDFNQKQLDGRLEDIINPFNLMEKLAAFGFETKQVSGNDAEQILSSIEDYNGSKSKPLVVILNTVKGQGVPFIENMENNHHLRMDNKMKAKLENILAEMEKSND